MAKASPGQARALLPDTTGKTIRVFYRWDLKPGKEHRFTMAWAQMTRMARARVKGARGSLLLRNTIKPSQYLAIARWDSLEDWQAFRQQQPPDPDAAQAMIGAGDLVSTEVFSEIEDRLDYESWKSKMIRVYGIRVKPRGVGAFVKAWLQATKAISKKMKGARGSLLMHDPKQPSLFIEVVRWDSMQDWLAFIAAEPADPVAFRELFSVITQITTETFDEVEKDCC